MSNVVPTDQPSIFAALNTLVLGPSQLAIIRPNNPPPGIAGFVLDLVGEESAELDSDIPDHYVEDLTAVNDSIALRPETVNMSGQIAELVKAIVSDAPMTLAGNPLPNIPELQPELSPRAQQVQDALTDALLTDNTAVEEEQSLYGYYSSRSPQQPDQTRQSQIFGYLYQLWRGRQLCSVETPWGFFENMAILYTRVRQGEDSKYLSDFEITFKKIRTARSVTVTPGLLAGRATFQQAPITLTGTIGQAVPSALQSAQFYQRIANPLP